VSYISLQASVPHNGAWLFKPASQTEMLDDQAFARTAYRRPQRQIPQKPGDRRPRLHDGRRERERPGFVAKALARVIAFDDFNADNDPHREQDFGSFELEGEKLFWKIVLYERELVRQTLTGTPYEHRLIEGTVHQGRVYPKTCRTRAAPGTPLPCQLRKVFACYASIGLSRCEPLNVFPLKP
jgi:Protein of unknown function (DUF3768)